MLAIDEAKAELFFPRKMENHQTTEFCKELLVGVATMFLAKLTNPRKSTHNYINDGLLVFLNLSAAEKEESLGMRANNDPSEGNFTTFTNVLCNSGQISIDSAAGIGRAQYNKDLEHNHGCFVTRGRNKCKDQSTETGAFHTLPEKLQDSLLAVAKKNGSKSKKAENAIAMKLKSTEKDVINISYLYQKYFSPRC